MPNDDEPLVYGDDDPTDEEPMVPGMQKPRGTGEIATKTVVDIVKGYVQGEDERSASSLAVFRDVEKDRSQNKPYQNIYLIKDTQLRSAQRLLAALINQYGLAGKSLAIATRLTTLHEKLRVAYEACSTLDNAGKAVDDITLASLNAIEIPSLEDVNLDIVGLVDAMSRINRALNNDGSERTAPSRTLLAIAGAFAIAGGLGAQYLYSHHSDPNSETPNITSSAVVTPAPAPAPVEAAPVVAPKPEPVAVDTVTPVSSAVVEVAPVAPKPEVVSLASVTPTPAPVEATSATTNAEVVTANEVREFGPEEAPKTYGPMRAPTAAPAEVSTDYGQLETLVEAQQIPEEQTDLYVAALNGKIVKASTEDQTSAQLEGGIHDTAESLAAFRAASSQWGGWGYVWSKMDKANKADLDGNPIDTPSEFFDYLSSGAFPHGTALEQRAQREMALMTNPLVVTQPEHAEAMLVRGYAQADGLLTQVVEEKPQAPAQWTVETSGEKLGLYDAPDAHTILNAETAFAQANVPAEEKPVQVNPVELPADPTDVPESQFAQTSREETSEVAPANAQVSAIADWMEGSLSRLLKKARGRNLERLPAFIAQTTSDLRTLAQRFDTFTTSGQEVALLDVKRKFFERMNDEETGLVRGDGSFFSQMYADFSGEFMTQLSAALPKVPESQGVEGIQERVNGEIRATISGLPERFFRKA